MSDEPAQVFTTRFPTRSAEAYFRTSDDLLCDTCQRPVAPITGGYAHLHATADDAVTDWHATAHVVTVNGAER